MLKRLKSFFTSKSKVETSVATETAIFANEQDVTDAGDIETRFRHELTCCPYIKPEAHDTVIEHLTHRNKLTTTGNILSKDEKKALGLNPSRKFTKEFVDILTAEGISAANHQDILGSIYNKVTTWKSIEDSVTRMVTADVKKFKLRPSGGGNPCGWCIANKNKTFDTDILNVIKANCTCNPYPWSYVEPIIKF